MSFPLMRIEILNLDNLFSWSLYLSSGVTRDLPKIACSEDKQADTA